MIDDDDIVVVQVVVTTAEVAVAAVIEPQVVEVKYEQSPIGPRGPTGPAGPTGPVGAEVVMISVEDYYDLPLEQQLDPTKIYAIID